MNFLQISNLATYDKNPFVLIDRSGSTGGSCKITKTKQTILDAEIDIAHNILQNNGINKCRLILWDSKVSMNEDIIISKLKDDNFPKKSGGSTYLAEPLSLVFTSILSENKKSRDLYILTDGEICDEHQIGEHLSNLFAENINIYIITVESNNVNYYDGNCDAGNTLYEYLKNNSKMNYVKKIIQYNNSHKEGFTALHNFDVPEGYLPFRESVFLESSLRQFNDFLKQEVLKFVNNDNALLKLVHDLSRTIFFLSKNKEAVVRQIIVETYSHYFKNTNIYNQVRKMLLSEIDNHINHKSSTFQDYKSKRNELFEYSQLNLMDNTKIAITNVDTSRYISFPIKTNKGIYVFNCDEHYVTEPIHFGKLKFNTSCVRLNNGVIPVFPTNINLNESNDQCLRQWIRENYSHIHNVNITSGKILNYVLLDMLYVHLSNLSNEIKNSYVGLAKVMLNAKIYGTDTEIINELKKQNELSSYYYFNEYLIDNNIALKPGHLWYGILYCLNNDKLLKSQAQFYEQDVSQFRNGTNEMNNEQFFEYLRNKLNMKINELSINQKYKLPSHDVIENIECPNNFISDYDMNNKFIVCDKCHTKIKTSDIIKLHDDQFDDILISEPIYCSNNCENVKIELNESSQLYKINDLNFDTTSYNIQNVMITDVLNSTKIKIKTKENFINRVHTKYPFLKDLDMSNVCLAGGFVRSVLLDQKMKDFDFFVHGTSDPVKRVTKLMNDLIDNIIKVNSNSECTEMQNRTPLSLKFLYMYKPLYNVFEIVCIEDPTNHFTPDFSLDKFSKYKFDTLKTYDRKKSEKRDEYYFEDGDDKGIKMKYRFQFVMHKFNSIEHVLESFDITPACVAFDGDDVFFTQNSFNSYKYGVNIVKNKKWSLMYDSRMSKYFSYGFDIIFPQDKVKNIDEFKSKFDINHDNSFLQLCSLKFDIRKIIDNKIIIKHDSHKKELIEKLNEFEKECQNNGKTCFYRSSLFCSLVSLLRYVCINQIPYIFCEDKLVPDENGMFKFKDSCQKLEFIDKLHHLELINTDDKNKWYIDHYYNPQDINIQDLVNKNNSEKLGNKVENNNGFAKQIAIFDNDSDTDSSAYKNNNSDDEIEIDSDDDPDSDSDSDSDSDDNSYSDNE